jgi:hypothetical protein
MTSTTKTKLALAAIALTGLVNSASAGAWILDFATPWVPDPLNTPTQATWTKTFSSVDPQAQTGIQTIYGYYDEVANTLSRGPSMITATITTTGVYNGGTLVSGASPLTLQGAPDQTPYVTYILSLSSPVTNLTLFSWDIDSDPSAPTMTDLWGWKSPTPDSITLGAEVELKAGAIPGYTSYGVKDAFLGGNSLDNPGVPWIPEDEIDHTVAAAYTVFQSGDFVWGFRGTESTPMTRGHALLGVIAPEPGSAMTALLTGAAMVGLVNRRKRQS